MSPRRGLQSCHPFLGWESFFDYNSSIMPPRWGFGVVFVTILELFHPFGVTIMSPRRGLG
jgi:hypothetical protein